MEETRYVAGRTSRGSSIGTQHRGSVKKEDFDDGVPMFEMANTQPLEKIIEDAKRAIKEYEDTASEGGEEDGAAVNRDLIDYF